MLKVTKASATIPKTRKSRPIAVSEDKTFFDRLDTKPVNILYHKSNEGYRLIFLNKCNKPIRCWSNIGGISTIKASLVKTTRFDQLLRTINPKTLYLNDGEHLDLDDINISVYSNKNIYEILAEIEIQPKSNNSNKNNNTINENKPYPTYEVMLSFDPTMTKTDYNKFARQMML